MAEPIVSLLSGDGVRAKQAYETFKAGFHLRAIAGHHQVGAGYMAAVVVRGARLAGGPLDEARWHRELYEAQRTGLDRHLEAAGP